MFIKASSTAIMLVLAITLTACAAQTPMNGMQNMNRDMCKKMMAQGKCDCCQNMRGMGDKPMQCMPQSDARVETIEKEVKTPDPAGHTEHHPAAAQ